MYNVGKNGFIVTVCFPAKSEIAHVASNPPKLRNLQFSTFFQHHPLSMSELFGSAIGYSYYSTSITYDIYYVRGEYNEYSTFSTPI